MRTRSEHGRLQKSQRRGGAGSSEGGVARELESDPAVGSIARNVGGGGGAVDA